MRPRRPAVLQNSQLLVHLPFPSSRDEKLVTETPLDSALTNADVCKSFRIRSYANCRVSPALFSQSLISDPVSSTLVPRIGRSPVRGFFSVLSAVNCGLSTACPEGRRRVGFCANSFRCNTYEQLASVDSKRLAQTLNPLDATLTKKLGGVGVSRFCSCRNVPTLQRATFKRSSSLCYNLQF